MRKAYLYYEAGQAVAAAHLGLKIRHISGNPALAASEILLPKNEPKAQMILWLTGLAAEKKAVGRTNPLRRTRNRARIRTQIEAATEEGAGSKAKRLKVARNLLNQAQDRANSICANLYDAIDQVAATLDQSEILDGDRIVQIVTAVKAKRTAAGQSIAEEPAPPPAQPSSL